MKYTKKNLNFFKLEQEVLNNVGWLQKKKMGQKN